MRWCNSVLLSRLEDCDLHNTFIKSNLIICADLTVTAEPVSMRMTWDESGRRSDTVPCILRETSRLYWSDWITSWGHESKKVLTLKGRSFSQWNTFHCYLGRRRTSELIYDNSFQILKCDDLQLFANWTQSGFWCKLSITARNSDFSHWYKTGPETRSDWMIKLVMGIWHYYNYSF